MKNSDLKDRIYLNDDVIAYLVSKGYERRFVIDFLTFLGDEVRFFASDPEICDIRIEKFCSIFLGISGCYYHIHKEQELFDNGIMNDQSRIDFWKQKLETIYEGLRTQYRKKYSKRRFYDKDFKY